MVGQFSYPKNGIHILNSHYISEEAVDLHRDREVFKLFLKDLSKYCTFLKIEDAARMIKEKNIPNDGCYVAFTFDDGFEECYSLIAPELEVYGCNAAFFVNANYIGNGSIHYLRKFNNRISTYTKKPLTWQQVKDLHVRGHIIGSHTLDHFNLVHLDNETIAKQVLLNKSRLEAELGYSCDFFAWPYGKMTNISNHGLHIASISHTYMFSSDNYSNYTSADNTVINRRHIEPFWPMSHVCYFLNVNKKYR